MFLKVIKYLLIIIVAMIVGASILAFGTYKWYFNTYDKPEYEHFGKYPLPVKKEIPPWERKISLKGKEIKIGLITDTHLDSKRINRYGSATEVYMPEKYKKILENFETEMKEFKPEFLIHLGDVIEGTGVALDVGVAELKLIKKEIDEIGIPTYWAIGNHDLRSVARKQFEEALGIDYINTVIDKGPYRFIIFDANYHKKGGVPHNPVTSDFVPGFVSKENMAWLESQLKTDRHVYMFMHHSLAPAKYTTKNSVSNDKEVRKLLSKYHVDAVFYGHIEKRFFGEIDGVKYYSFPGIKKSPRYPGAYYDMTITEGNPKINMFHLSPLTGLPIERPFFEENEMASGSKKKKIKKDINKKRLPRECVHNNECASDELCNKHLCKLVKDLVIENER